MSKFCCFNSDLPLFTEGVFDEFARSLFNSSVKTKSSSSEYYISLPGVSQNRVVLQLKQGKAYDLEILVDGVLCHKMSTGGRKLTSASLKDGLLKIVLGVSKEDSFTIELPYETESSASASKEPQGGVCDESSNV